MFYFNLVFIALTIISLIAKTQAVAATSVNIPVGSYIYQELERLEVKGLIKGSMLSTKPLTRFEATRLLSEAEENWNMHPEGSPDVNMIILRLREEFKDELEKTSFIKPVDNIHTRFLYSEDSPYFTNINNNGDAFREGFNFRANISLSAGIADAFSLYLSPEYRLDEDNSYGELVYGYLTFDAAGLRLEIGRDSMWWGAGYHGNLLVTNNAKPFDMAKVTSQKPFVLPWFFKYLGLFKPTIFLARLEEDRDFPRANLLGMRLDFKPTQRFQFGLNRVFMFGGHGRKSLNLNDWLNVLIASDSAEHSGSPIDGNQIASIDASYVYVNEIHFIPFSGIKLYTEWGAEDSSGDTKSPTGRANIYGAFIDEPFYLSGIDFRVEWANTARNERYGPTWYQHGVYSNGYTYEGNIIGHHMGTDARDLFLRVQYHFSSGSKIGIEADHEWSGVHSANEIERQWGGLDFEYLFTEAITFTGGVGIEDTDDTNNSQKTTNTVSWLKMDWLF